jgi:hypothetical protein
MAIDICYPLAAQFPPKSPYLTPEGSHVSSLLFRKAHNVTMKTFVPPGTKWYNKNICYRKAHNGNRRVTPPGSGNKKKRFHGSHVSNILGRKAHNGTIKTFVPQCAQIPHLTPSGSHVSSILFRKAHNVTMETFVIARRTMVQ